jgi:hypothetical protein
MPKTHALNVAVLVFGWCTLGSCGGTNSNVNKTPLGDGADDPGGNVCYLGLCGATPLSAEELAWFAAVVPTATIKWEHPIPVALLTEDDVTNENTIMIELFDDAQSRLAFARDVFTSVDCVSGVCQAIRFMLVFDTAGNFSTVFHQASALHDFMKYTQDQYLPFTEADRTQLNSILQNPPAALDALTDSADLVVGVSRTAPTKVEYQGVVVAGAAFTTYTVLMFMQDTKEIIRVMFLGG